MNNNQPPIIPPPELVREWCYEDGDEIKTSPRWYQIVATKAARWGADQELEACVNWLLLNGWGQAIDRLRAARRPKAPSLKEQALAKLGAMERLWESAGNSPSDLVRRALEALPDD